MHYHLNKHPQLYFQLVRKTSVPPISELPKPIANQAFDGPVNVNVVVSVSASILIFAVNPESNVCVPVEKLCANRVNDEDVKNRE